VCPSRRGAPPIARCSGNLHGADRIEKACEEERETEMTFKHITATAAAALLSLQACTNLTPQQRTAVGLTSGAAAGLIAADELNADDDWRLIAALAGAAAGTVVAQNSATRLCAYARGDGTYYTAACP
jgi:hypothetical protein